MLRRSLAATLSLLILAGFGLAETFQGLLVELTDSKLTILVRVEGGKKPEKKTLDVSRKVSISQPKGEGEKPVPFAVFQNLVNAAAGQRVVLGVLASVSTDGSGQVVAIKLGKGGLPEKAAEVLEKADQIELYSLEPLPEQKAAEDPNAPRFHGWLLLGKTTLKAGETRTNVQNALDVAVGRGQTARCFEPRHGIRATHGDKTVDMVICFACGLVDFYDDAKKREPTSSEKILKGMQPVFDEILKTAKVPLAVPRKE